MENEYKYCSALTSDGRFEWLSPVNNHKEIIEVTALEVAPRIKDKCNRAAKGAENVSDDEN